MNARALENNSAAAHTAHEPGVEGRLMTAPACGTHPERIRELAEIAGTRMLS